MPKNNLSPLPFYTDIEKQNQRLWFAYGDLYSYNYELGFVPSFQIIIEDDTEPTGSLPSSFFDLVQINNEQYSYVVDVKDTMISEHGLSAEKFADGYIIVKCLSTSQLNPTTWNPLSVPGVPTDSPIEGHHYLKIVINNVAYCSEIFTWKENATTGDRNVTIKYKHDEDITYRGGHIDYSSDFEHQINTNTTIAKPIYEYTSEELNRLGYKFPIHQVSNKRFRFEFFAPEYILDALRIVRMHDFVTIEHDGMTFNADDILFTERWLETGHLAQVVCEFSANTGVSSSGSSTGDTTPTNPTPPPDPDPIIRGDYNSDYSNDYFNL